MFSLGWEVPLFWEVIPFLCGSRNEVRVLFHRLCRALQASPVHSISVARGEGGTAGEGRRVMAGAKVSKAKI